MAYRDGADLEIRIVFSRLQTVSDADDLLFALRQGFLCHLHLRPQSQQIASRTRKRKDAKNTKALCFVRS